MDVEPYHPIIVDAINNRLQITFRYHSENSQQTEPSTRVVEPWIYGRKNGKDSLYGFQVTGGEPGLRRFDMRRVKSVTLTGDHLVHHPDEPAEPTKWDDIFASLPVGKPAPQDELEDA